MSPGMYGPIGDFYVWFATVTMPVWWPIVEWWQAMN